MSGHGGSRAGAGAPRGGASETRRRLIAAIESGLEMAGRSKGLEGSRVEVIEQTGAHMVCDLILAGNVRDILTIWGQNVTKDSGTGADQNSKSSLVGALKQASNMLNNGANGTKSVQGESNTYESQEGPTDSSDSAMDTESNARQMRTQNEPMFIPQKSLPLIIPPTEHEPSQEGATPTPTPPHIHNRVDSENLENFSEIKND